MYAVHRQMLDMPFGNTLTTLQKKGIPRDHEQCPVKRLVLPVLWPGLAPLP